MDLSSRIKPNNQAPAWQHILLAVGLCGTGLVIFLLSGGFPPTTWRVLYQVVSHTATLQSKMGPGLPGLILLLTVQSLLIGTAWVALIWIAIREYNLVCTVYLGPLLARSTSAQQMGTPTLHASSTPQLQSMPGNQQRQPARASNKTGKKAANLPFTFGLPRKNKNVSTATQPASGATLAPANIYAQPLTAGTFSTPSSSVFLASRAETLQSQQQIPNPAVSLFDTTYHSAPLPDLKKSLQPSVLQTAKLNAQPENPSATTGVLDLSNPFETNDVQEEPNPFEESELQDLSNPFEETELDLNNPFVEQSSLPASEHSPFPAQKHWSPTTGSPFEESELQTFEPGNHIAEQQWEQPATFADLDMLQEAEEQSADFEKQQSPEQVSHGENSADSANFDNPFQIVDDTPEIYRQMETSWQPYGPKPTAELNTTPAFTGNVTRPFANRITPQDPLALPQSAIPVDQRSTLPLSGMPIDQRTTLPMLNESTVQVVGAMTHPGLKRTHKPNEDTPLVILADRPLANTSLSAGLFLVADGMGGHNDGGFASAFVTDAISNDLTALLSNAQKSPEELKDCFVSAIKKANQHLTQRNHNEGVMRGTTLTGALVVELMTGGDDATHIAYIANIGDSRTYHFSAEQGLQRITRDHSTVENLVEQGKITPEERYTDRRRNQIDRCMGNELSIEVDLFELALKPMERLLICSDGVWEMVRDDKLATLLAVPVNDPAQITQLLLQSALEGGGEDNITAIVVQIPS